MQSRNLASFVKGSLRRAYEKRGHPFTGEVRKTLFELGERNPQYRGVLRHSIQMKNLSIDIAERLSEAGKKIDVSMMTWGTLAHDSLKDRGAEHSTAAAEYWRKKGADAFLKNVSAEEIRSKPRLAKIKKNAEVMSRKLGDLISTDMSWSLQNYKKWSIEKKIVAYSDTVCRGVQYGRGYLLGLLPSKTAFRLAVSLRQKDPLQVDALVRERLAVIKFEQEMKNIGIDLEAAVRLRAEKNSKNFAPLVKASIDPKLETIVLQSMKRMGLTPNIKLLKL
ncbi:MAG: hypothetical protein WC821_00810 [archaeon]